MIAIIPARGGSKRIPRKNIKKFNGVPILGMTIETLVNSQVFDEIVVSTEDSEIAQIAIEYGAKVFNRPKSLADDFTTTSDVMQDIAKNIRENSSDEELLCCIYPINPFLNISYISEAEVMLRRENLDFVFSAKPFDSPIQRALIRNQEGYSSFLFNEYMNSRSQDLQESFHDGAMFYLGRLKSWVNCNSPLFGNSKFIPLGKYETVDIDDEKDWIFAEEIFKIRNSDVVP
jgi:N-acylneuraminate cytidylyltransferase